MKIANSEECFEWNPHFGKNMTDDTQEKIPFSLFIKTAFETTDVKLWENFANNIEFREEQISMGYNLADEFLKNLE